MREFAKQNFRSCVYLNLYENRSAINVLIPLKINKERTTLKMMLADVGLLTYQLLDSDAKASILSGDLSINEGSICENVASQLLLAHGFKDQFYINSKKIGEIDFLVQFKGKVLPIEIKSGGYYTTHKALDNLLSISNYPIDEAYIFAPTNIIHTAPYTYFPLYMLEFLHTAH